MERILEERRSPDGPSFGGTLQRLVEDVSYDDRLRYRGAVVHLLEETRGVGARAEIGGEGV